MEGWDCPFAYLLVMLDNTRAQRAIHPAGWAGDAPARCSSHAAGGKPRPVLRLLLEDRTWASQLSQVKNGLEQEGLTGLGDDVFGASAERRRTAYNRF